jgi:signal transduction histidine kinase
VLDDKNRAARFRVMGNRTEIELEISDFNNSLYGYLALFGLGMIAINAAAILLGMRPLGRVSKALGAIRAGNAERLDGTFPAEIAPLAQETNELIENNRRIMERARTQVGNLAHSLKTPLAVILNEARSLQNRQGSLIEGQAGLMQGQIDHYLTRARAVAQRDGVVFRTQVHPTLERMVRAMGKLKPGLDIAFEPADVDPIFAGEREDLEEIVGNLLDNAMKWGRRQVRVATKAPDGESWFECTVEDDGPGIPADKAQRALTRGQRLDESVPGTGLGLAIVTELVKEYGGELFLETSDLGGLRARFRLRRLAA